MAFRSATRNPGTRPTIVVMTYASKPDAIRASDDERNQVQEALGEHLCTGRLDLCEYEKRSTAAIGSTTLGDLADLFADLPAPRPDFVNRLTPPPRMPCPSPPPVTVAPYGVDPVTGQPLSDKSKVVAGLLQIFIGAFGIGRFYAGRTGIGLAQVLMTVLSLGFLAFITVPWGVIDGIIMLTDNSRDGHGRKLH
jgi:TM2 domain-containing membrane protein YozV